MDRTGIWSLSPAFDLCYSYDSANDWVNGHNMKINDKRKQITYSDLMVVGEKFNIKRRKKMFKKVQSVINSFPTYAEKNKVSLRLRKEVEKNRPRLT
jgi:serine/threonine-protein kinase HipA